MEIQNNNNLDSSKLVIEILECDGGAGHTICAEAIQKALDSHFSRHNQPFQLIRTNVGSHLAPDPLVKFSLGKFKILDLHNYLAKEGYTRIIDLYTKASKFVHRYYFNDQRKYFDNHFSEMIQLPSLVISIVPVLNGPLLKSTQRLGIPVLVATTDGDSSFFCTNWPKEPDLAPHRYGISYNTLEIAQTIDTAVKPEAIRGIGYPVRPEFTKSYSDAEKQQFRLKHGINPTHKHIGVMMGGLGGVVTERYFDQLLIAHWSEQLQYTDAHYTFFCGKNQEMCSKLARKADAAGFVVDTIYSGEGIKYIHPRSGMALTVLGFTKNVHEYMSISQLWTTKPGSSTFNECLAMGVPLLFDNTARPLPWESLNIDVAEIYRFGERVTRFDHFIDQLNAMLQPEKNEQYRQAINSFREDRPAQKNFAENVVQLTEDLLVEGAEWRAKQQIPRAALNITEEDHSASLGQRLLSTAKKIGAMAKNFCKFLFIAPLQWLGKKVVQYSSFSGFYMREGTKVRRRKELIQGTRRRPDGTVFASPHKAKPIEGVHSPLLSVASGRPIDALYIKSTAKNRTGNAIIYVLGKNYQAFHPNNYDHLLDDGSDIILFNPSELNITTMDADLKRVIKELKSRNAAQKLAIHGYSIGGHIAASAAADIAIGAAEGIPAETLPTIVDRGYGNGYELAKKVSRFAAVPFIKQHIEQYYDVRAIDKIEQHKGAMLFLSPSDGRDRLMHRKERDGTIKNLTCDLYDKHNNPNDVWIDLHDADHWTKWTPEVHRRVKEYLERSGIISPNCIRT